MMTSAVNIAANTIQKQADHHRQANGAYRSANERLTTPFVEAEAELARVHRPNIMSSADRRSSGKLCRE